MRKIPVDYIMECASHVCGVTIGEIKSKRRTADVADARTAAIAVAYELRTDLSLRIIGNVFRGRDHSTIHSAVKAARVRRAEDEEFAALYDEIKAKATRWPGPPERPVLFSLEGRRA